jgi:hypothetical protein
MRHGFASRPRRLLAVLTLLLAVVHLPPGSSAAPAYDFPDATNTGVPRDVVLKPSGSLTITTPGAVISGLDILGWVSIEAPNVTLKNCRVTATSFWAISVQAPGAKIENCEIFSIYAEGGTKAVYFDVPASGGSIRRCNIHDVEDGVYVSTRGIVIEDNFIHNLKANGPDPHYDAMQLHGGVTSNVVVRGNSVITSWSTNSAITTGVVQDILIENNQLHGGGYTVRIDGRFGEGETSGVAILNNRFGPHEYGYWSFDKSLPVVQGNVDDITGQPIQ